MWYDQTIAALFERSRDDQVEVTRRLGDQVRRAVEILIHTIDRIDRERDRELLAGFDEKRLYDAALTFMMRLVFLFSAEERKILLPDLEEFQEHYGILGLYDALRESADRNGEEVLERRHDVYVRLLATFRAVFGGIQHPDFSMPAYGGTLFDPDRYPFLEGRTKTETGLQSLSDARPLLIDNRTVLHLLQSLQFLQVRLPGGGPVEARRISFKALSVEQIGHVYEGLLDHTGRRAEETLIALRVNKGRDAVHPLAVLEKANKNGRQALLNTLHELTGRAVTTLERDLDAEDPELVHLLAFPCDSDEKLIKRIKPFAALLERDTFGYPLVIPENSVFVGEGQDRRSSGTHYTPRSLTEPIVHYTLEPLVYEGPAEGRNPEEWKLKTPDEILALNVCDPAMGSGAFLVQACRYLAERLREAWKQYGAPTSAHPTLPLGNLPEGELEEEFLSAAEEEQRIQAMRLVAERCLYGVDINPMAVEMAKLSLWLETAQKNRPFTFLDHAFKCGDSLLGVGQDFFADLVDEKTGGDSNRLYDSLVVRALGEAAGVRRQLEELDDSDITVIHRKEELLRLSQEQTEQTGHIARYFTGALLLGQDQETLLDRAGAIFAGGKDEEFEAAVEAAESRRAFIWFAEFPEVFDRGGFDGIVGNPPFMGGSKLTGAFSTNYREYLVSEIAKGRRGNADLSAYFFLRSFQLLLGSGSMGLLATNTIAQGDTREVGLDWIVANKGTITRANPSRPWPGEAGVHVASVWVHRGPWEGSAILENEKLSEQSLNSLSSYLTVPGRISGKPFRLRANQGLSYNGSKVYGMGFVLDNNEVDALINHNSRNKDVLFPYLTGQDLNSRPDQSASRWVICFFDWPLDRSATGSWFADVSKNLVAEEKERAAKKKFDGTPSSGFTSYEENENLTDFAKDKRRKWIQSGSVPRDYPYPVAADYPDILKRVIRDVKPGRDKLRKKGNTIAISRAEKWWRFGSMSLGLYSAIATKSEVIVITIVNNKLGFCPVSTGQIFAHKLNIFTSCSPSFFALLQSTMHYHWAWRYSSTMKSDINYSPTDCFETFPFPNENNSSELEKNAADYISQRAKAMNDRPGITKVYNALHDPDEMLRTVIEFREGQKSLDIAVRDAYGWSDLDLNHDFHETKQGIRFTISESARLEVLDRLLELNHQRYAEEVAQGLHDKKKPAKKKSESKKKKADADDEQGRLL